jgi:hypothetical protein
MGALTDRKSYICKKAKRKIAAQQVRKTTNPVLVRLQRSFLLKKLDIDNFIYRLAKLMDSDFKLPIIKNRIMTPRKK